MMRSVYRVTQEIPEIGALVHDHIVETDDGLVLTRDLPPSMYSALIADPRLVELFDRDNPTSRSRARLQLVKET